MLEREVERAKSSEWLWRRLGACCSSEGALCVCVREEVMWREVRGVQEGSLKFILILFLMQNL